MFFSNVLTVFCLCSKIRQYNCCCWSAKTFFHGAEFPAALEAKCGKAPGQHHTSFLFENRQGKWLSLVCDIFFCFPRHHCVWSVRPKRKALAVVILPSRPLPKPSTLRATCPAIPQQPLFFPAVVAVLTDKKSNGQCELILTTHNDGNFYFSKFCFPAPYLTQQEHFTKHITSNCRRELTLMKVDGTWKPG